MRTVNLHLPTSWNRCTTAELEAIAAAIVEEQAAVGRFRPFLWERVKLHIVLAINGLSVLESDGNGEVFLVQRDGEEPFPITTGQLADICERLNWLTDEKADKTIFLFPYQTLMLDVRCKKEDVRCKKEDVRCKKDDVRCKKEEGRAISHHPSSIIHHPSSIIHLQGPPPLLDGYTWREYRWLTDWMQEYMRQANAMAQVKGEKLKVKNREAMEQARNEFLAILFKPAGEPTGTMAVVPSDSFAGFSPVKWQVILFWWSSLMQQLSKKFPKVFKQQPVSKNKRGAKPDTPWDFYNRVTATIQKYVGGLSAQDVDAQPYGVTLQQLEMMADEAAEMEKLKKKK